MSNHDALIDFAKAAGYSEQQIRGMTVGLNEVSAMQAAAERSGMIELKTPVMAAAESPRNRRILEQTCGQIRHLSAQCGAVYHLPLNEPVNLPALSAAISKADPESRIAVKSNLAALGLC